MKARILVVEGHPRFADALARVIHQHFTGIQMLVVPCLTQAIRLRKSQGPFSLVLLDMTHSDRTNLERLTRLVAQFPMVAVGVICPEPHSRFVNECLEAGALGVIANTSDGDALRKAIRSMLSRQTSLPEVLMPYSEMRGRLNSRDRKPNVSLLTRKQACVFRLLCQGLMNREIAAEMGVTESTIKAHVTGILKKLKVNSRAQAVLHLGQSVIASAKGRECSAARDSSLRHGWGAGDADERLSERLPLLTGGELDVLHMLGQGLLNKQIAFRLGVSEGTVKSQVNVILRKLGLCSRTQVVIEVLKCNLGELRAQSKMTASGRELTQ